MFATSQVGSIWLEMSINWHTTSQGPKKKCIKITKRRIDPCPAHTARNKGSFTTMVLYGLYKDFWAQLYLKKPFNKPLKFFKVIFWNVFQIHVRTDVGKPVGCVNFFTNSESTGSTSPTWDFINGAVKNEVLMLILGFFGLKSGL